MHLRCGQYQRPSPATLRHRQRQCGVGRLGRADARHHLDRNAGCVQYIQLFLCAGKDQRVTALEPNGQAALVGAVEQDPVDG